MSIPAGNIGGAAAGAAGSSAGAAASGAGKAASAAPKPPATTPSAPSGPGGGPDAPTKPPTDHKELGQDTKSSKDMLKEQKTERQGGPESKGDTPDADDPKTNQDSKKDESPDKKKDGDGKDKDKDGDGKDKSDEEKDNSNDGKPATEKEEKDDGYDDLLNDPNLSDKDRRQLEKDRKADEQRKKVGEAVKPVGAAADAAVGSNTGKDLAQGLTGTKEDGSEADDAEQAISALKVAGKGAALYFGQKELVPVVDAVGEGLEKGYQGAKKAAQAPKKEIEDTKKAASGKQMVDAAMSEHAKANVEEEERQKKWNKEEAKKDRKAAVNALAGAKRAIHKKKNEREERKRRAAHNAKNGTNVDVKGGGIVKKASMGLAGALVLSIVMVGVFLSGGQFPGYDGQPAEESDEQVAEYLPAPPGEGGEGDGDVEGWYEVAKWSVDDQTDWEPPKQIPWTIVMGIAAEQTEFGRYSPYDAIDRDPERTAASIVDNGSYNGGGVGNGDVVIENTGDMDRTNPAWRQQVAMEGLVNSGWTPEQAAGIVGNMITESGVEPTQHEIGYSFPASSASNARGWGIVQWTWDRHISIKGQVQSELGSKYYTNQPATLSDEEWLELLTVQLAYVNHELDTEPAWGGSDLRNAQTAEEASFIFLDQFERPACPECSRAKRAADAEAVLQMYEQGGVDAIGNGTAAVTADGRETSNVSFNPAADEVTTSTVSEGDYPATSTCPLPPPDPIIGGEEGQGVGPYLLTEDAAARAADDGYNPQSPCVGQWIADELSNSTSDVLDIDAYTYHPEAPWPYGEGDGPTNGGNVGNGTVQWPIPSHTEISSPYGMRFHPIHRENRMHAGIDFSISGGTPIKAIANGTVTTKEFNAGGWGNYVVLTHDLNGVEVTSLYAHMQEPSPLSVGDTVTAGAQVGKVGTTGGSTGNHLHLEITINGEKTDPEAFLNENAGSGGNNNVSTPVDEIPESELTDEEKEAIEKFEDNQTFWEATIASSMLFKDRHDREEQDCYLPSNDPNLLEESDKAITQQIVYSFHCEIAQLDSLTVVQNAEFTTPPTNASEEVLADFEPEPRFTEYTARYDAELAVIYEALNGSFTASKWVFGGCEASDNERKGLFMLTADEARDGGISPDERCDPGKSAAAAAKLFADGEREALEDRPTGDGPFQPAMGGWDNISSMVGTVDRDDFVEFGSPVYYSATGECRADMEQWIVDSINRSGGGYAAFDGKDPEGSERTELVEQGKGWTTTANPFATKPPHTSGKCYGGDLRSYMESAGEIAATMDVPDDITQKDLDGFSTWAGWVRAGNSGKPVIGESSLIPRLSVHNYTVDSPPISSDNLSRVLMNELGTQNGFAPVQQRAVEFAIFFGGLSQPFDTAEKIIGSLADQGGSYTVGDGGSNQTEVDAEGCPTELPDGAEDHAMSAGAEAIGINELCKRSVAQARTPEAAEALKWAFTKVGDWWYSQPKRMQDGWADCSSYISRAYVEGAGVPLYPEGGNGWVTSTFRDHSGSPRVGQSALQPGDWFEPSTGHVVFVIADGFIMHASQPGQQIKIGEMYQGSFNVGGYIDVNAF